MYDARKGNNNHKIMQAVKNTCKEWNYGMPRSHGSSLLTQEELKL